MHHVWCWEFSVKKYIASSDLELTSLRQRQTGNKYSDNELLQW